MSAARTSTTRRSLSMACSWAAALGAFAQLTTGPQTDLQQLASTITGPGVVISDPQINCHAEGYGEFSYSGSLLGIDEGILLTSGSINNAIGPNNAENRTLDQDGPGSSLLTTVAGRPTFDACTFEFDVIPAGDSLQFDFVFASEEYNEYVGSQYNDVFGFFISGPGITGDPGIGADKNIALIPGTNQAVTINNVNSGSNPGYYFNNAGGQYVQYDGFTQGLRAVSPVEPCQSYHLKLIVADASDRVYDSGVFIAKVQSNPVTMALITDNGSGTLIEGCNPGLVRFTRQLVTAQPLDLEYYLQGTAVNGTDYAPIGNPLPSVPKTITIPANQASAEQPIGLIADGVPEGAESLLFILGNPYCPGMDADTLTVPLMDSLQAAVVPATSMICSGGQIQLTASGGENYSWTPAAGLSASSIPDPIAQPTTTTTYSVAVTSGACSSQLQAEVKVSAMQTSTVIVRPLCHGDDNGAINLSVSGGIPPYSFQWSGPDGYSASTEDISGIAAGAYTVVITDAACSKTVNLIVGQPPVLGVSLQPSLLVFGQNISCHNGQDGSIDATVTGGIAPYSALWNGPGGFSSSSTDIGNLGEGTYTLVVTDQFGCTAMAEATLLASAPLAAEITDTAHVACAGNNNGSATVIVTGGMPAYSYLWNTVPAQTSATASGLAPGAYTVTATDQYGCTNAAAVTITGPAQPLAVQLSGKTDVTCQGAANGSATLSVSGGTPGYSIAWNTVPVQTGPTASGLGGGTYTATITDANGCQTARTVTITEPSQPLAATITAQENIACPGQGAGSATVLASGGTGPYSYAWNTAPAQYGAAATGLPAGNHTVIITDANGCTTSLIVEITAPAESLEAEISSSLNVLCAGSASGSATVVATGGAGGYTYQWNTTPAQQTATAVGLAAGTWQVTVEDANACSATAQITIGEPDPLVAEGQVSPAQCQGNADGAVDLEISGGVEPYTWAWTGPNGFTATTQNISGIAAGGYNVAITDANGCTINRSFNVNQPGLFDVNATPVLIGNAHVSCPGSNDGSIALDVTGALPPYEYAWSGPNGYTSDQEDPSGLAAGGYQVTITDDNGCSASLDVTLNAPAAISATLPTSNYGGYGLSCNGGSNGTITAQVSGGNAPYTTAWSGPNGFASADAAISGLQAGAYQATITDANGCTTTQSVQLTQPAALVAGSGGSTPATCYGSNTGQATAAVTGGVPAYIYTWNTLPAQHAATATGLAAGNYTVSITDANGCTSSSVIAVGGPAQALVAEVQLVSNVLCHGGNDGSATAAAVGGTPPYAYAWNTIPTTNSATVSGLNAGTWTVTATDAAGCTATSQVVIDQPALPLNATWEDQHNVSCFGDNDGSASIIATGGSGDYSITWNTLPTQTGSTATGLAPGMYTATIADANGCAQTLELPVYVGGPVEPLAITWTAQTYPGGAHVSCPGTSDGNINLSVTGGTPDYQFHWQDGLGNISSTEDLTNIPAGEYQLHIADGHGCLLDSTIILNAPAGLSATATIQSATCHGANSGTIDLTPAGGAAPYSYQWTGPNGFTAGTQDLGGLYAGVYHATITDINGCVLQQPFDVSEPGMFTFDATVEQVSCASSNDGAIQLTAAGGTAPYQYAWTGPTGYTANTANIQDLAAGSYHLTLTDDNGCSALFSTTLQAPSPLHAYTISSKNHGGYDITCAGASDGVLTTVYYGGTPPYSFAWTGPGGFTASTPDISGLAAGTYTLTITDANGCSVAVTTVLVAPPALAATAVANSYAGGSGTSCQGAEDGSIILTPAGGTPAYTVAWNGPGGFTASAWQITGLAAGTYTATVTDANGCTATAATAISAPDPIALSITGSDITCHGGSNGTIDLGVSGGSGSYIHTWSGPGAFAAASEDLSGVPAGTYTVVVADANGCQATTSITLVQPLPLTSTAIITTAQCQGANTGSIDLSPAGGTGSYTFQWSGFPAFSAITEDISALLAGVYTVNITDDAGCTATAYYNVGEPGQFQLTAQLSSVAGGYNVSCATATDGSIDAAVGGGTGPYTYFWNGPDGFTSINLDLTGLAAGEYHLTVHDANGCNAQASFSLVAPAAIQIGLTATAQPACNGGNDGSIHASISGGTAPYTASWTGPDGPLGLGSDLSSIGAGIYQVQVTDALGCTATASINLAEPGGINATATAHVYPNGTNHSCANTADGSIDLVISGGTGPYLVTWNGPGGYQATTEDLSGLLPGIYTATITDASGCTTFSQAALAAPPVLALEVATSSYSNGNGVSCAGAQDGTITLAISGGSPGYTTSWSGPGGFFSTDNAITGLAPGTYTATVTDNAGCATATSVDLVAPAPITVDALLSDHSGFEVGCGGNDGAIDLNVSGGLPPYQFSWSGPNGFAALDEDLSGLAAGNYSVLISDANNCTASRAFVLQAPAALTANLVVTSNECDATSNGAINLTVAGGTEPYTVAWSGPNGFSSSDEDLSGLAIGTYSVEVTSAMGCTTTAQAEVIAAAPMSLDLYVSTYGQVNIPCHGDSTGVIELAVAGGFQPLSIAWNGPDGFTATTFNLSGLPAGLYTATVVDDHGCMRDTSVTLVEPGSPLLAEIGTVDVACHGGATGSISTTVTGGDGPYLFDWRGPDSASFSTADITALVAGVYELVVTDANQCVDTLHTTIHQPDSALAVAYALSDHQGFQTSCADAADGSILLAANGGTAGYLYSWSGPNGFTSDQDSISGLVAGTYVLAVTDAMGCTYTTNLVLNAPAPLAAELLAATFPSGSNISCHGANDGSINAVITGGVAPFTLLWSGPGGFTSAEAEIDSLIPGTYCLTVSDTNACSAQQCITLAEPAALSATATGTEAACGQETGTVNATVAGGSGPYSFDWSNGAQSEDLAGVAAGSYVLLVADANGCSASATAVVEGSPAVEAHATVTAPLCHSSTDGSVVLTATGGEAPFSYLWADGSTNALLEGIGAGGYAVTITDANGCTWEQTIVVAAPDSLAAETLLSYFANGYNVSTWGGNDGSIALQVLGGTAPYSYLWGDGATTDPRTGLPAGTYPVIVTDANGCTLELSITLTQPDDLAMPTGFTPNGDGQNDAFVVHGIESFPNNRITVFNRWGNAVYDRLNYANDWRGENQQGQDLPNGTYFVVLQLGTERSMQNYVDLRR